MDTRLGKQADRSIGRHVRMTRHATAAPVSVLLLCGCISFATEICALHTDVVAPGNALEVL